MKKAIAFLSRLANYSYHSLAIRWGVLLAGTALSVNLVTVETVRAEDINRNVDRILRSMSNYVGSLPAFSVEVDIDVELIDKDGQKLQLTSLGKIMMERPSKFYFSRRNFFSDVELFFDGTTVTINGKKANAYFQFKSPGIIDEALTNFSLETSLDMPASDLFYTNTYKSLLMGVKSASYYGTTYVNGVECHHLAFRKDEVDWQLWVQAGDAPLPMKYIITSKWVTGAPQYSIRLRNWDTSPQIAPGQFEFVPPQGAKRLKTIPVNKLGELVLEGVRNREN
ncbi:MAG: DUF2092 domain-containing protein [Prochloraceae cyanobacterium]